MAAENNAMHVIHDILENQIKAGNFNHSKVSYIIYVANTSELMNILLKNIYIQLVKSLLKAWNELINNHPDIFDDRSLSILIEILENKPDDELVSIVLSILKHACLKHEFNRQNMMNAEILRCLQPLLKSENNEVISANSMAEALNYIECFYI